ncbi:urease accessory protein ureD, putative [Ixodes scapularis]|uniref:Urease accessory protein ureD, putative n=1 Tax=Ixodes scapularis TaxID=6945 RepID=B7PPR0_IXOSC|nr:urease accessory protein ureD, putative [Ixodes scapularis]|eukprot:XP_002435752.1 urease accessory protein ureD, putative [Ixodes scapularis]
MRFVAPFLDGMTSAPSEKRQGSAQGRLAAGNGQGILIFEATDDNSSGPFSWSEATRCFCTYPLKVFLPRDVGRPCCRWIYPAVFGGGLVSGDVIDIDITLRAKTCVLLTSQSFPKVYVAEPGRVAEQRCRFSLSDGALLCVLPDLLTCFRDASYRQEQAVRMAGSASLVLLDWFLAGRVANGERWDFTRLTSVVEVYLEEQMVLREALDMADVPGLRLRASMGEYNVVGTCIVVGPHLTDLSSSLCARLSVREDYGVSPAREVVFACSPFSSSCQRVQGCVLRFGTYTSFQAYSKLEELLQPLFAVLGGNPFHLKY